MAILVTGGTGFLGRSVVRELSELGDEIVLLARSPNDVGPVPDHVRIEQGDVTSIDDVSGAMVGCSTVVHLAAMVTSWHRTPRLFEEVNVGGIKNVIRAASFAQVDRIVYTSTILALGPTDGGIGDEEREPVVSIPGNHYSSTKARGLHHAREEASMGAPITFLYPGIIYGPGKATEGGIMTRMLDDLVRGRLPGLVGGADRRWCHAFSADVARGHRLALEKGKTDRGYILGGVNATLAEWLEIGARESGVRVPRLRVPYPVARFVGHAEVLLANLFGRQPLLTPDVVEVFRHEWAFSSDRAVAELDYSTTSLEDGIAQTLDFLRRGES